MKLQELNKLNEFEKLTQLHEITKGYDKYLVAELLNNFYNEAFHQITIKHKDVTESTDINPTSIYLNGFHFKHFGFDSWNNFTITIEQHLFDFGIDISWHKPNKELNLCRELFDAIIKLENVLSDKCLDETQRIELANCEVINNSIIKLYPKPIPIQSKNNGKASLTISEIALKCFYEGTIITRENAKNNLIGTGHTSGEKLYLEFCKWSNRTDRKSDPETKVRLNNKIKIFEKVIAELPENKKEIAKDELQILYSFMHKYQ